jgi:hypothetical protein
MSGLFKLNGADFLRGLIVAVLSATLTFMQQFFSADGSIATIHWKTVGGVAAASAIAYILKNLFTNSQGEVVGIKATAPPPTGNT